jgi:hypothetical protein
VEGEKVCAEYRRRWRKENLGIDSSRLKIRATNSVGNAPAPALHDQIPGNERIADVSADGAYDAKDCRETIAMRAAHAIISTRMNVKP